LKGDYPLAHTVDEQIIARLAGELEIGEGQARNTAALLDEG